jgi:hypothetical protein
VDAEPLYEAADMLYRGEGKNPLEAYDQAAARILERDAQREGVRGGGEEVYPPRGERGRPRLEEGVPEARAGQPRPGEARKLARQEVSPEDVDFINDLSERETGRKIELLDSIPLKKALAEQDISHLKDVPLLVAKWVRKVFS